jgi:hypothetical protein
VAEYVPPLGRWRVLALITGKSRNYEKAEEARGAATQDWERVFFGQIVGAYRDLLSAFEPSPAK